jgi:hypothetical protein
MRKKIKVGDKVYCVSCYNNNLEIEEKEITKIKENPEHRNILDEKYYYLYDKDFINNENIILYYEKYDYFFEVEGNKEYYRTKKKAIHEAIKKIKSWIKSFQGSILEHKELLKELNKELKNDIQSR